MLLLFVSVNLLSESCASSCIQPIGMGHNRVDQARLLVMVLNRHSAAWRVILALKPTELALTIGLSTHY
jgi:hypothetical protein